MLQAAATGPAPTLAKAPHELPPLILHPITGHGEPLPAGTAVDVESCRLEARRIEMKMLCCLGKDLNRWIDQCMDFASGDPSLGELHEETLLDLLVENPPASVAAKMQTWGVADFRSIFARSLGLNAVFPDPPGREQLGEIFVRNFARYAEALYRARRQALPTVVCGTERFHFEVYASGEYAKMLEQSWGL